MTLKASDAGFAFASFSCCTFIDLTGRSGWVLLVSPFDDVLSIRFIILGFAEDDVLPHPIRRQPVFKLAEVRKVHFLRIEKPFRVDVGGQQLTTKSLTHFPSESQRQTVIGRHLCRRGKIDEDLRLETSCARLGDRVGGVRVVESGG